MVKILLIGEARGENEDELNHGFVGASGQELALMLAQAEICLPPLTICPECKILSHCPLCANCGISIYPTPTDMIKFWTQLAPDIEITNVFEIHPPNNDLGHIFSNDLRNDFMPGLKYDNKKPQGWVKPEYHHHVTTLWERINKSKPNLCILLGNTACWAVLKETKISEIRGTTNVSSFLGCKTLPTYHPAAVLYNWSYRPIVVADLIKSKRESEYPEIRKRRRRALLYCTLDEIENWINQPADHYTIDIESGYALFSDTELRQIGKQQPNLLHILSKQISMIGFARSPTDMMQIQFMSRDGKDLSFWPDKQIEVKAWKLAKRACQRPIPKIFQNGLYDMTRLLYAGIACSMPTDDTMLLQHAHFPEMLKGLGFLGSIYANENAWKQAYGQGENLKGDA